MKFNLILLVSILFISCTETPQQSELQEDNEQTWQVEQVLKQVHSYNKLGLLDITQRVQDVYVNGVSGVVMNFLITREYDKRNNLIREKTFQVFKKKNELSEEVLYNYDDKNNLVLITEKSENVITKIVKNTYNDENQKIEEVEILKKADEHPAGWNLDSAIAHHGDKKNPSYDTFNISYQYDTKGNMTIKTYKNSTRYITLCSNNQKILTYGITQKCDTISITNYKHEGSLTTETDHHKNDLSYHNTTLYNGDKIIETVLIDKSMNYKRKETYKYDNKGNEIEHIWYK